MILRTKSGSKETWSLRFKILDPPVGLSPHKHWEAHAFDDGDEDEDRFGRTEAERRAAGAKLFFLQYCLVDGKGELHGTRSDLHGNVKVYSYTVTFEPHDVRDSVLPLLSGTLRTGVVVPSTWSPAYRTKWTHIETIPCGNGFIASTFEFEMYERAEEGLGPAFPLRKIKWRDVYYMRQFDITGQGLGGQTGTPLQAMEVRDGKRNEERPKGGRKKFVVEKRSRGSERPKVKA
ncbi:hypothetical protein MNV49_005185 [Pseudohyphozyma bogoriensis]|nr:hypothetical protein MNV49_005185 [Pseudohyphozyma bogoriensis]